MKTIRGIVETAEVAKALQRTRTCCQCGMQVYPNEAKLEAPRMSEIQG